jgi:hydroxyethylthiazole kinase
MTMRRAGSQAPNPAAATAARLLDAVRARRPRVHCLTNTVAQAFTANMLLAIGAIPSMTIATDEIEDFVTEADALLVNLGTFDQARREAALIAIPAAKKAGIPWVLDPVLIDRSPRRAAFAVELMDFGPDLVRANADEAAILVGDATRDRFGLHALTLVETGPEDTIRQGERQATVVNGHPMMARVTAMGCAGTAVIAAFLAVERDAFAAAEAALIVLGIAGELAAARAEGVGTFAASYLDALDTMDADTIATLARTA